MRSPAPEPRSSPTLGPNHHKTSPYNTSLDKIDGELTVFVFACVDARQLATAMERPRPVAVAAVSDQQHTRGGGAL
jgi:hypothetical protein